MFDEYTKQIPLTFLLGFYISSIVTRWWTQFENVAWPDDLLSLVCILMPGVDNKSRLRRHTIARYLNLTAALAWRDISSKMRRRFPSIQHIVNSGLMTEEEYRIYESFEVLSIIPLINNNSSIKVVNTGENSKVVRPAPLGAKDTRRRY